MQTPPWTLLRKLNFLCSYGAAKMTIPWNVRSPRWTFFGFELRYSLGKLVNAIAPGTFADVYYSGPSIIQTTNAKFFVRPNSIDATIVSPAYERSDFKYLVRVIEEMIATHGKVTYVDVGANVGAFAISLALRFPANQLLIWAAEPAPGNLEILNRNMELNGLDSSRLNVLPFALSDKDGELPLSFSSQEGGNASLESRNTGTGTIDVRTCRGDDVISNASALVLKVDVEGHEEKVIDGLTKTITGAKECWICVEDGERISLYESLRALGLTFTAKKTPYNSWWHRAHD